MQFRCGAFTLDLNTPQVMGIINVTPDSFSDGGQYSQTNSAVTHALKLIEDGAAVLDIGGESTRPNATPVPLEEELQRVIPVIEALVSENIPVPISIDTYKPAVMKAAMDAGASIVNDVRALLELDALQIVAGSNAGVCLMHMQGTPQTMQENPHYENVVAEVKAFLRLRRDACLIAGIPQDRILLDPGFGFGKTRAHNITLAKSLADLLDLDCPLLVGLSRKSVLGQVTGNDVDARLYASIAAAVASAMQGAHLLRVHDVKATVEALKIVTALK
ncbi:MULTISPECIES: dihydropteroate synthase [unclassified Methylophilus]|uniref:dihydropteroate synthase n=1 Tax=unclassified Methylophilus TaxID=2630143 RepID=UPI0006FE41AE|nr:MULTISPECIES: dihydropteroate synthase [unclassified Methylophilus]KQT41639.1 dihydropteroate synthase [Methylophilus sp. Leaf416]KQT55806.1 dihydropteroate synthase [Methylophilus sp. Leaf459]